MSNGETWTEGIGMAACRVGRSVSGYIGARHEYNVSGPNVRPLSHEEQRPCPWGR